jgi:hypothetical protein
MSVTQEQCKLLSAGLPVLKLIEVLKIKTATLILYSDFQTEAAVFIGATILTSPLKPFP